MHDALVFSSASHLEFQEVRANVIRIPEVVNRVREAQRIWDTVADQSLDLANFIASDDTIFLGQIKMKSFATAIVQVGLLDRYLRQQRLPEFLVGVINGDSPLKVAMGMTSFVDLVAESPAVGASIDVPAPSSSGLSGGLPLLAGIQLAENAIFKRTASGAYERVMSQSRDLESMLVEMADRFELQKLITVGPGNSMLGRRLANLTAREIQVVETIDMDPLLSWFWATQREGRLAIAN